jgi:heptosyltransferase-2
MRRHLLPALSRGTHSVGDALRGTGPLWCRPAAPRRAWLTARIVPSPLIVRLPNHLGDACMCLPALDLLAAHGHRLALVGRGWARALFAAYDWPVTAAGAFWPTVRALRALRSDDAPGFLFTNSFSTALQFRLAGVPATGYARDGRALLLQHAVAVPAGWHGSMHMVEYYLALAGTLTGTTPPTPRQLTLKLTDTARAQAAAALAGVGVHGDYVVLCPAAVGLHRGRVKAWSGFGQLAGDLRARGLTVVASPGPGETDAVRAAVPGTTVLPEMPVDAFAALLAQARLVVANDSGAGHVAAAVNAPLLSVFGVTEPTKTRPWGPRATLVGSERGWPDYAAALGAALAIAGAG